MNTMFLHSASGIARRPWPTGPASSGWAPLGDTEPRAATTFSRAWPSPVKLIITKTDRRHHSDSDDAHEGRC